MITVHSVTSNTSALMYVGNVKKGNGYVVTVVLTNEKNGAYMSVDYTVK